MQDLCDEKCALYKHGTTICEWFAAVFRMKRGRLSGWVGRTI